MPLKFTCPGCGTLHTNIDKRLFGQPVQCCCGKIIQLGGANSKSVSPSSNTRQATPADTHASVNNLKHSKTPNKLLKPIDPEVEVQANEAINFTPRGNSG